MSTEGRQINKSAIRNFAIEARNILIKSAVTEAGFYGITKDEIKKPVQKGRDFEVYEILSGAEKRIFDSDIKRRAALVEAIRQKGFDEVMEETAYTWFNRLIAIRFMEVNNYLPFRMRVLSSDSGSLTPDIVSRSLEVDLNLTDRELEAIQKAKDENSYDEAFRLLFIKVCNELNGILPGLFEKTDDYMELLLKLPYTSDGVIRMLVDTIPESNFNVKEGGQVEIIGWLYQYYNTEPKAKAFAKKGKITKEEIPAVTQLFTPDWIVRYMVENSLGRLWVEHLLANGDSRSEQEIANDFGWKYYLPEAEQEPEVQAQLLKIRADRKSLTPEDILCIDPCQGSGHILVYLFEVLMQIYREDGYSERDAARCILERNLYGLDIDDRAYQLSYFAVLMKARQYDRMILKKHIQPHVYSIQESNSVNRNQLKYFGADMSATLRNNAVKQLTGLLDTFKDAKEYGSILNVDCYNWDLLRQFVGNDWVEGQMDLEAYGIEQTKKQLIALIEIGEAMALNYLVVVTNPPYMGNGSFENNLSELAKQNYTNSKNDLYSIMIERCGQFICANGYVAMITMQSWLNAPTFKNLRKILFSQKRFLEMINMGSRGFDEIQGEKVKNTIFIFSNQWLSGWKPLFLDLTSVSGENAKREKFLLKDSFYAYAKQDDFLMHEQCLIIYKTAHVSDIYSPEKTVASVAQVRRCIATGNDDDYIRSWYEVSFEKLCGLENYSSEKKWYFVSCGGEHRRWYGNLEKVLDWEHDGANIKRFNEKTGKATLRNIGYMFKNGITYTYTSMGSGVFNARLLLETMASIGVGPVIVDIKEDKYKLLAFLNSKVFRWYWDIMYGKVSTFETGNVGRIVYKDVPDLISELSRKCVEIAKDDWDSYENSYDFKRHPMIPTRLVRTSFVEQDIAALFSDWYELCKKRQKETIECEEAIDAALIDAYGLRDEISLNEYGTELSIRAISSTIAIKSLISFAVGCMFGRYSLDFEGVAYAGGPWKEVYSTKYKTFLPDEDGIIPITDEEYFKDDIVARFVDFIRIVYGEKSIENNLKFIADALGNKGDTPRAVIRNYFLNDFYKDHCNTYSVTGLGKRPIYWLFDSGKQNGFKALIYIHRYTPDTVGLIRSVYLHNAQAAIQNSLQNSEYIISTTTSATERARETKKKDKYVKQLNELRPYYQALSHIALQRIQMDLDDGVKKNYQLFQGVEVSTEGKKKQTINLLAKI